MIVYRASELGSCTRRLVLGRVGYDAMEPPEKYKGYFARGDETEEEVKADLRAKGWGVHDEQKEVTVDITEEIKVVGHIDGTVRVYEDRLPVTRLLEVKRMNDTYWNVVKNGGWYVDGLMEKYRWQISSYMHATGLEVVLVCRNGDTGEDHYLYAEMPMYTLNDIKARVIVVEGRVRSFTTQDFPCDQADYPCPFYYTHPVDREDADGEEAEQIEGLGIAYGIAKERERIAKEDAERCRDEIRDLVGSRAKVNAGRVRVTVYAQQRKRFDRKLAIADGVDVAKYETSTASTAVRITTREEIENSADEDQASS